MNASPMTCRRALAILIAETDTQTRAEVLAARAHASRCPGCHRAYVPQDLHLIAFGASPVEGHATARTLRIGLFLVSVTQLALALPWLFGRSMLPDSHVAVSHLTRDGALGVMIAALGLVTVWRPRYVHATRLMAFVVLGLQVVAGLADHDAHSVSGLFEVDHLPVVLIVVGLCLLAAGMTRHATPKIEPHSPVLRVHSSRS